MPSSAPPAPRPRRPAPILAAARPICGSRSSRAYWALVTARETVRVLEQALATADGSLDDVRARVDAGLLPPNDVSRSLRHSDARSELLLIEARSRVELVSIDLAPAHGPARRRSHRPGRSPRRRMRASRPMPLRLVSEAMSARPELAGAPAAIRRASRRGSTPSRPAQADGERRLRVRLRAPQPAHLPASVEVGRLLRHLRSTWSGRSGTQAAPWPTAAEALANQTALAGAADRMSSRRFRPTFASSSSSWRPAARPCRRHAWRWPARKRRDGSSATASRPAWPRPPTCSTREVAEMQAELDRTRALADIRLTEARLTRALGR